MNKHQQRITNTINWLNGIPYENSFWEYTFRYKNRLKSLLSWSNLNSTLCLPAWDAMSFLSSLSQPKPIILDVGCGMSYATGNLDPQLRPLNIHYVDALANYFNSIKNKYQPSLPNIEFGMMEYIGAFYPNHNISLIIIQNALDHCSNPMKAILEALDALHIGGCLYLNHHPNEAEHEHYRGFHKFNICVDDNLHLLIWNQSEHIIVDDEVRSFATMSCTEKEGNPIAILTKTANIPSELLQREQDVQILCNALLHTADVIYSPAQLIKKNWYIISYKIVQAFIQLFPWKIRQNIKSIFSKIYG